MNKPVRKVKAGGPPPTELPVQPTQAQLDLWAKEDRQEQIEDYITLALAVAFVAVVGFLLFLMVRG